MKKREPVSSIMTDSVITVSISDHLRDVKKKFSKENIRHLPVMNGDNLVGIISKNDIMRLSFGSVFENQDNADEAVLDMLSVDQVMTHKPKSIKADMLIRDVAEILVSSHFHSLPVVDDKGKVVGIVTSTDIIQYLLEQY
jgi:CBS domain-containing protein